MSTYIKLGNTLTHNAVGDLKVVDIRGKFLTIIPSRFPPIALFERIANDGHDEVAEIESITNPRLKERARLVNGTQAVDVESPLIQNWNHAPFTYLNPEGSRFFGPEYPVLELSSDLQTALAVSVRKREVFLSRTKEASLDLDMRVLSRTVKGRFVDATDWDIGLDQDERWARGKAIVISEGVDGILFRVPERPTGTCIAILNGGTLDRAVQGDHYRFVWDGHRIRVIYSFGSGTVVNPEDLSRAETILVA